MSKFVASTVLEFVDRFEGQILHVGDIESCRRMAKLVDAISYNGDEMILDSSIKIAELDEPMPVGTAWRMNKASRKTETMNPA